MGPGAVLAWLLDEAEGGKVEEALSSSDLVAASELTLVECDRALLRAVALGERPMRKSGISRPA